MGAHGGALSVLSFRGVAALLVALLSALEARPEDGCAPGTFSVVSAPDARAASVLFDDFSVQTDGGVQSMVQLSRRVMLSVLVNASADRIALHGADHRGFALLAVGQSSALVVTHAEGVDAAITSGPFDGDMLFRHVLAGDPSGFLHAEVLLARQRLAALTHLATTADALLGVGQRLDEPSGVAAIAATGSRILGVRGH